MTFSYAEPMKDINIDECFFYHVMDLPEVGRVGGSWDLRAKVGNYLGLVDYTGKRVLDVGTASGYLTFEMEKRGAEVVSFDMVSGRQWDVVPHASLDVEAIYRQSEGSYSQLQKAYWFAHNAVGSKAKVCYGDIYDMPADLGQFDISYFAMILCHLRDPFQALYSASRLTTDTMIVVNSAAKMSQPFMKFQPSRENLKTKTFWMYSDKAIIEMLGVVGFEVVEMIDDEYDCPARGEGGTGEVTTFIAHRIAP